MNTLTYTFKWKLQKLKEIHKAAQYYSNTTLISDRFFIPEFPLVKWELCIEISKEITNDYFGVYLRQFGPNSSIDEYVDTKYEIYAVHNHDRKNISRSTCTCKLENQEKLGFSTVKFKDVLNSEGKDFDGTTIFEGTLILYCEVKIIRYNPIDDLQNIYKQMLDDEIFTDCVIKVDDVIIKAHRCVLSQNEVFRKMFEANGMIEAQNNEIIISDFSPECVRAMFEYFYTKNITKATLENYIFDIFAIADKYQVTRLKYECERFMIQAICDNFFKYCEIISIYGASTLEEACKDYIQANKAFLKSKEWEKVEKTYPQLAFNFLKNVVYEADNENEGTTFLSLPPRPSSTS